MKKALSIVLIIMLLGFAALGEDSFDGTVYEAYAPKYDEAILSGMEIINYIEPQGLLLSAYNTYSELSVNVEESDLNPDAFLRNRVNGVSRYGQDIAGGTVTSCVLAGFEKAAYVSYSFKTIRGSDESDTYYCKIYAAKLNSGYIVTVSLLSWGSSGLNEGLIDGFMSTFSLEKTKISTTYTAFLTYCERRADGVYITLDYCDMEYDVTFGLAYALNADESEYTYKISENADVYLPEIGGALYSLRRATADDAEISIAIESYYNYFEVHAVYLVLFNESGEIIRLQHYNAI